MVARCRVGRVSNSSLRLHYFHDIYIHVYGRYVYKVSLEEAEILVYSHGSLSYSSWSGRWICLWFSLKIISHFVRICLLVLLIGHWCKWIRDTHCQRIGHILTRPQAHGSHRAHLSKGPRQNCVHSLHGQLTFSNIFQIYCPLFGWHLL